MSLTISLSSVPLGTGAYGERDVPGEPRGEGGFKVKSGKNRFAYKKSSPFCVGQVSAHWSSFP